jgi:hypothetical protein
MRLRRGEHARLHTGQWTVTVGETKRWGQVRVTERGRWSW